MDRQAVARPLFRGRRADLLDHSAGARVSRESSRIDLATETGSAASIPTDGRGFSIALMLLAGGACGASAIGLARNAQCGGWLAIAVLVINIIGDSLNALLRHDPKTLIGLPIGGLMILYLLVVRR